MSENITQTTQDYLKSIYELSQNEGSASTNALAARLGLTPASVTGMLQRLANSNPPLVDYQKHRGATLTPSGNRAALEVIRHHRLIETYLVETLGYSWDQVHEEAERLEHVISEDFEARIAALLGNPSRDPHGELIPTVDLTMPPDLAKPLLDLMPGQKATIERVRADDTALLRHLESLGLIPGTEIEVTDRSPFDNNISLRVGQNESLVVVGTIISKSIFVKIQ